jgi:predicted phage baseplate assembly protein
MALPTPHLDDRLFQEIVDDVKRQIGLRCPEWTDHNVSDPGVTLIELFAWMTELILYRLNQVPEKNYLKFLEMVGVELEPPDAARTDLLFRLSRAIEDRDGEEAYESLLPARRTVAATVRTETEEAIEFATDRDLRLVRPRLVHIVALPAEGAVGAPRPFLTDGVRVIERDVTDPPPFAIFSSVPRPDDALYLGFHADVSGNVVALQVDCVQAAATGLDETYPAQFWEVWNATENMWGALRILSDTTCGFNRDGVVELALPPDLARSSIDGRRGIWVRCRYTIDPADLPPRGPNAQRPSPYQRSPEIREIAARVVGGLVTSTNSRTIEGEILGLSDGTAGQIFTLRFAPVLTRRPGETLRVGRPDASLDEQEVWTEVPDFSESTPQDRHFVLDSSTGEVLLGPSVINPDGSVQQRGVVPLKGLQLRFGAYRIGGGSQGNVRENQVRVLKSSIPYISEVSNLIRASGGLDQETLERAKLRGQAALRQKERAVTADDFEYLAKRASSGVGRARCLQPLPPRHSAGPVGENIPPGVVRLLLVPAVGDDVLLPTARDLIPSDQLVRSVAAYLDERRLLTTVLEVGAPDYVFVSTDIELVADPRADADQVRRRVEEALTRFVHPLVGGTSGTGWPFGRPLNIADLYAVVGTVPGVAFLLRARVATSRVVNALQDTLSREEAVGNERLEVTLAANELLCTREHRVQLRPIWEVSREP